MKSTNPKCVILCLKCAKIHRQASGGQIFFAWAFPQDPGGGKRGAGARRERTGGGRFDLVNNSDIALPMYQVPFAVATTVHFFLQRELYVALAVIGWRARMCGCQRVCVCRNQLTVQEN